MSRWLSVRHWRDYGCVDLSPADDPNAAVLVRAIRSGDTPGVTSARGQRPRAGQPSGGVQRSVAAYLAAPRDRLGPATTPTARPWYGCSWSRAVNPTPGSLGLFPRNAAALGVQQRRRCRGRRIDRRRRGGRGSRSIHRWRDSAGQRRRLRLLARGPTADDPRRTRRHAFGTPPRRVTGPAHVPAQRRACLARRQGPRPTDHNDARRIWAAWGCFPCGTGPAGGTYRMRELWAASGGPGVSRSVMAVMLAAREWTVATDECHDLLTH